MRPGCHPESPDYGGMGHRCHQRLQHALHWKCCWHAGFLSWEQAKYGIPLKCKCPDWGDWRFLYSFTLTDACDFLIGDHLWSAHWPAWVPYLCSYVLQRFRQSVHWHCLHPRLYVRWQEDIKAFDAQCEVFVRGRHCFEATFAHYYVIRVLHYFNLTAQDVYNIVILIHCHHWVLAFVKGALIVEGWGIGIAEGGCNATHSLLRCLCIRE